MNKGKKFEQNWRTSANNQGLFILRLSDSSLSWQHEHTSRFQVQNPCDFISYYKGYLFPMELKSSEYKSMSIERKSGQQAMIKLHQYHSLTEFSQFEGVIPIFIFNYREKDSTDELTYALKIQDFNTFLVENDKKSINSIDVHRYHGVVIDQKLKRTNYTYDVKGLFDKLIEGL